MQPKEFTLTLNEQEVGIIGSALVELPFKIAQPLIAKLQTQINEQATAETAE